MISKEEQDELFETLANHLSQDTECYAFGGTAMMYHGYKDDTKDIDLLFLHESDRDEFISAIESAGFSETSAKTIYIPEKLRDKTRPLMFERDSIRFDLFARKIFRTQLSTQMKEDVYSVQEYKKKHTLSIKVFRPETIVQLKSITDREKDVEDIFAILKQHKKFDWQYLIDECVWQHKHGDSWILLDMEKTIKALKGEFFIPKKYLDQLYAAQN